MLIGIEEDKVLTAGCLSEGFLGLWCHIVADPTGGFHRLVVGVLGLWDLHLRQGWWWLGWVGGRVVQTKALASIPVGEGYRWCTGASQVFLFLY
jgi:hypothetical protein